MIPSKERLAVGIMKTNDYQEAVTYLQKEPDVELLSHAYSIANSELGSFYRHCREAYDDRRNWWPGKSRDLRKGGADAFPWEGASDLESHVIDERITRLVSLFMSSLNRSSIRAFPVEVNDLGEAKLVSNFLKWMSTSGYIPRFKREMELGANYLLERGIMITHCGWIKGDKKFKQRLVLADIAQAAPELAEQIINGEDEQVIVALQSALKGVQKKDAKKALKQLRKTGEAEVSTIRRQVNSPTVKTLGPDGDWIFPSYTTDPQRAPHAFWKTYYTAQELLQKVSTDGWNADWVDHVIETKKGVGIDPTQVEQEGQSTRTTSFPNYKAADLVEVIHGYQRLIDEVDDSEGIYLTVFHPSFSGDSGVDVPSHAKFELLNGYEEYPVVVTRLSEDTKRMYDTTNVPELLRGIQTQVKVERDSRMDANSMATLPPLMHPVGQAPTDWGPGRRVPERRPGSIRFGDKPQYNPGSVEMEQTLQDQADRLMGLDEESQISSVRRQFLTDKFLQHAAEVLALCYKNFQRFGPDEVFFQVTGVADPQKISKGDPSSSFDVTINFDTLQADPEAQEKKLQQFASLIAMDTSGRIDREALLTVMAQAVDPVMADAIIMPAEQAQDQIKKDITDDLAKIHAGMEVPARANGAQVAMQIIQQYAQQPDIAEQLQSNEAFAKRLETYAKQYQFAIQQNQNAEIGRIGTQPAAIGQVRTQDMAQ